MDKSPDAPNAVVEALKAAHLREVLHQYGDALKARRKGIDRLNVYPVPDGDTGTNMSLTVQSVVTELKGAVADDMHTVAGAISKGAIMGARGNSGAILAQVLRGVAESAKGKTSLTPHDIADALERARKSAYESVLKPVEGTILTVVTAAAESARSQADKGAKLKDQLDHMRAASAEALARTPELLPVLKQAGVVDAGGSGFLLFVDALRYVATGEPIPGITDDEAGDLDDAPNMSVTHTELSDLRYEVMFLLDGDDAGIPAFRETWGEIGDSIVVVGGDGLFNCHIHSDDIGAAIEAALDYGRPRQIRITDLLEQASAEHGATWAHAEPVETAVVAVVNGDGMDKLFRSFGVQQVVTGGQSMNPSVAELLNAVKLAPSDNVILLPNNKNIVAAANQVNDLTDKSVTVIATKSTVEGLAAVVAYDAAQPAEQNVDAMRDATKHITCGEVTQAVRTTSDQDRPIKKGDWLGLEGGEITVVAPTLIDALTELVNTMVNDDHEVLTLIEGDGADEQTTSALKDWLGEHRPAIALEVHTGGQPSYPYLVGVE